jgi:hypothetical protein
MNTTMRAIVPARQLLRHCREASPLRRATSATSSIDVHQGERARTQGLVPWNIVWLLRVALKPIPPADGI